MRTPIYSNYIDEILRHYRSRFRDKRTFKQFRKAVYGFIAANNVEALTALIDALLATDRDYNNLDYYFKDGTWGLEDLNRVLIRDIGKRAPLHLVNGRLVACGDGKKEVTDAKKFPNTSLEKVQSESASKKTGLVPCLNYSCISVVCEGCEKLFSILAMARIANGNKETEAWQGRKRLSQTAKMAVDFQKVLKLLKRSAYLALDRFYLSDTILAVREDYHKSIKKGDPVYDLVMRVKSNAVVYEEIKRDPKAPKKVGRPKKHQDYKIFDWFETRKEEFKPLEVTINGETTRQEVLCETLFWGKKKRQLKFLLSRRGNQLIVLATTDLDLTPAQIIEIYTCRFTIETAFKEDSHYFGTFNARFHAQCLEPYSQYAKKGEPTPRAKVKRPKDRQKVLKTMKAHEGFALHSMIAAFVTQMFRLECIKNPSLRLTYKRTYEEDFSLHDAKVSLGRGIKGELSQGGIKGINSLLSSEEDPVYPTRICEGTDRGKNRISRRHELRSDS